MVSLYVCSNEIKFACKMLRQMVFKNFIHFKDFQCLTFENGSYFFIGANSSGKTSTFEILRRCMSTDINKSISSSYDEKENAYAFCKFDVPSDTKISKLKKISSIYSGVVKKKDKEIVKILCLKKHKSQSSVIKIITHSIGKIDNLTVIDEVTTNAETSKRLIKILMSLSSTSTTDEQTYFEQNFIQCVLGSREKLPSITDEEIQRNWTEGDITVGKFKQNLSRMHFLEDIESTYVATMAMRAIGPLQWTRSHKITRKEDNYLEACKRAEIINELMTSKEVDHDKAESIFKFLTHPSEYKFESTQNRGNIFVKEKNSSKFHLLKTPEGIIEAKQFSLIMAHKNFNTICLDEPDRCMHPQMVERMRDIFRSESSDKVVIVISHNPFLINSITAEKTHVFFRNKTEKNSDKVSCGIHAICDINRHITDVDNLKKLIFAAKILCMEGTADKILLEGLFDYIVKSTDLDRCVKQSILSHQMVVLGSKTFDYPVCEFCEKTGLSAKWVFDRDKYIKLKENKIDKIYTKDGALGNYSKFKDRTIDDFLQDENGFLKLSNKLSEKRIFIWKSGELEDTIKDSLDLTQLKEIFKTDNPGKPIIKKMLPKLTRDEMQTLAEYMYCSQQSTDIKRFITFLESEEKISATMASHSCSDTDEI
ncbi:uncharacterized protein LOC127705931 [Mytilus californianus]|uniref:uncharacterized protein LOC127705931 n=1 Tax=Mytilus californianus TaxID=6549 RepID=UPI0022456636|nr:uncharacterized protein LOC127705931 [Mytilus californianus]